MDLNQGSSFQNLKKCVACTGKNLQIILDLGSQPLANEYSEQRRSLDTYPLAAQICNDCIHAQLTVAVNPKSLFQNYQYVSGTSETMSVYFTNLRNQIIDRHGVKGKLLDIGSNDGSFLEKFEGLGWEVIGVDPAINLISESAKRNVVTIPTFFTEKITSFLSKDFDVIVAMNVFAHTDNPESVLNAMAKVLKDDGRAYIQTSQADMFINGEFDTIYHEHISFFNVRSMRSLLNRTGWKLKGVSIVPVHGNSYLWEIEKSIDDNSIEFFEREQEEERLGLYSVNYYENFANRALSIVGKVRAEIELFKKEGYVIASYGAAAKGNTFINFANIEFDYIFDDTPYKIGKFAPAGGCVVSHPSKMTQIEGRIFFVIPAWNFAEEIQQRIQSWRPFSKDSALTYYPSLKSVEIQNDIK